MRAVLIANVAATLFLLGMIATIQMVHYPLFGLVRGETYVEFMDQHRSRITALLLLPWAVEGITSLLVAVTPPAGVSRGLAVAALVSAAGPVALTVGGAIQAHGRLASAFDDAVHRRLLVINRARVAAWALHAALALLLLWQHLGAG